MKAIWKNILKKYKKHKATIDLISLIITILTLIQSLTGERIVLIQRIREIELPTLTEAYTSPQFSLHISAYASAIVDFPNGTIKQLTPQESIQDS